MSSGVGTYGRKLNFMCASSSVRLASQMERFICSNIRRCPYPLWVNHRALVRKYELFTMRQEVAHYRIECLRTISRDIVARIVDQGVEAFRNPCGIDSACLGRNNLISRSE